MAIRLVIADAADLMILGVQQALLTDHRMQVVGTARSLPELLSRLPDTRPDAVLVGAYLHGGDDIIQIAEQIKTRQSGVRMLIMGGGVHGLLIRDLFVAGVDAYLYTHDDLCELLPGAITSVLRGRPYLSPTANAEYLVAMHSPQRAAVLDRESREVLQRLARGEHIAEIAYKLGSDARRVYWVREKLRRRFGAKTNEHLISRAAAEGFIYPRD